ncbi:MAG: dihydroorotase [Flavobacteriaceae bacterium]|nr:dihydroorotase [Flavobacteriaceae bacterium]
MNVLLKSVTIISPRSPEYHKKKRDILIKNGQINKIATSIRDAGKVKTISIPNLHVSPGWFDSGVCFGEPGYEERETLSNGLKVAANSGFTAIVLQPNTNPLPDTSGDVVFLKKSVINGATSLYPLGTVTVNSEGKTLAEMFDMHQAGAIGFYDHKRPLEHGNVLKIALQYTQNFDGLVYSFPLDADLASQGLVHEGEVSTRLGLKGIPSFAEELRIKRDLAILEYTGGKLHFPTISTTQAVDLIAAAKAKGLDVSCSVALQNLWCTDETLHEFDSDYKVQPPLRSDTDRKALREGLRKGIIDMVISDHTPINIELKRVEFEQAAFGSLGLESMFGVLNSIYNTSAAIGILLRGRERFGLERPKIAKGEIADLTLFDPKHRYVYDREMCQSTSKNSLFFGSNLKGKVYGTLANSILSLQK